MTPGGANMAGDGKRQPREGMMTSTMLGSRGGPFRALLATGVMIAMTAAASAAEASDVTAGEALAIKLCSRCHVVSEKAGPPFAEIAKGPRATPGALRDFLRSTHADVSHPSAMPSPGLTEPEIDDLAAYIDSLRPAK